MEQYDVLAEAGLIARTASWKDMDYWVGRITGVSFVPSVGRQFGAFVARWYEGRVLDPDREYWELYRLASGEGIIHREMLSVSHEDPYLRHCYVIVPPGAMPDGPLDVAKQLADPESPLRKAINEAFD